jgi:hypothetical protein
MKITVGGVVIQDHSTPFSLSNKMNDVIEETNRLIESKNRDIRRSRPMKKILALLGFVTTIGVTSVASAEVINPIDPIDNPVIKGSGFLGFITKRMFFKDNDVSLIDSIALDGVARQDTLVWKLNNFLEHTLLNTQDFFDNPEILSVFNAIWYICMSFVILIISKKGFDMVKARVLGTTTLGASELIIRLLASVVMTFLSLDIMQFAIEGSNLVMKTLFKAIETHLIPYDALEQTNSIGLLFWFIGFIVMFVILGIQYWIRQITVMVLGVITPIANTAWVVDGGAMLGTLIREFITLIATPLVHGIMLSLGSVAIFEVTTHTGNAFADGLNSILIGFATMFLMVVTPTFLRKFTTGSFNPVKWSVGLAKGTYGNAIKLASLIKK